MGNQGVISTRRVIFWQGVENGHNTGSHEFISQYFIMCVAKSMIREEEDEVSLTAADVYLAFCTQTESRSTSAQYNTVHKQHKLGLSRAKLVSPVSSLSLSTSFSFMRTLHATYWNKTEVFVICT